MVLTDIMLNIQDITKEQNQSNGDLVWADVESLLLLAFHQGHVGLCHNTDAKKNLFYGYYNMEFRGKTFHAPMLLHT